MRTVRSWVGAAAGCVALLAGCSSSSGSGNGWAGTWSCNVTDTLTLPGGSPHTSSWMEDFSITEGSNGQISVTPVVDAGMPCSIAATESGTTATFATNQACGDPSTTYGGTMTLNGNSLGWDYDGNGASGGFQEQVSCTRR